MSSSNTTRKVSRGRQRIPIARIENKTHRMVTFSKRRLGLFKKASEMSALCGTEVAMLVFSPTGKAYAFGNPNFNTVLNKYFSENPMAQANYAEEVNRVRHEANMNILTSQITNLEDQLHKEMLLNRTIREAKKNAASISSLQFSGPETMKHHMENLRYLVFQKLYQPSMVGAQSQAMDTYFGTNDAAGPSHA